MSELAGAMTIQQDVLRVGDLVLDVNSGWVQTNTRSGQLSPTDTDLLSFLMLHSPRLCTAPTIRKHIWPMPPKGYMAMVRRYVHRVRRKIEDDPAHPTRLLNVRGFGYRIVAVEEPTQAIVQGH